MPSPRLLSLSNYIPEEITDLIRFESAPTKTSIAQICTYAQNFISQVLHDDQIDGAVVPNSCDSIRIVADFLEPYTDKFVYQLKHPLVYSLEAITYYAREIANYHRTVERVFNITITADQVWERHQLISAKLAFINALYSQLDTIAYSQYLSAITASLHQPLQEWKRILNQSYAAPTGTKRITLMGPYLSDHSLITHIERFGGHIIGDDLTNSQRYFSCQSRQVPADSDNLYAVIAERLLSGNPSPTLNDFQMIVSRNLAEIRANGTQGVIFILQKFCEPHDYLYPVMKQALDEHGIPSLRLQIENRFGHATEHNLPLATFLEVI